ncbi:MAG: DUF4282 domain-containing protein [Nevskiales bacterium]
MPDSPFPHPRAPERQPVMQRLRRIARVFLATLFDLEFKHTLTTRMVPIIYTLGILSFAILALSIGVLGFRISFWAGLFYLLVVAPAAFLASVLAMRVALEFVLSVFKLLEVTDAMYKRTGEIEQNTARLTARVEDVSSAIPRLPAWPFGNKEK